MRRCICIKPHTIVVEHAIKKFGGYLEKREKVVALKVGDIIPESHHHQALEKGFGTWNDQDSKSAPEQ